MIWEEYGHPSKRRTFSLETVLRLLWYTNRVVGDCSEVLHTVNERCCTHTVPKGQIGA